MISDAQQLKAFASKCYQDVWYASIQSKEEIEKLLFNSFSQGFQIGYDVGLEDGILEGVD